MLGWVLVERPGKVCAAPYLLICGRLARGPETEQGLERGHGLPAPIVAKDEFIKINLKLIAAHAVIGSDQPLLEIPNGAVCQRQHRLRAFAQIDSQGLRARHMLKSGLLQPRKALETVGVYGRTQRYILHSLSGNRGALQSCKPIRPAAGGQVFLTSLFAGELRLKFAQGFRKRRARHPLHYGLWFAETTG